MRAGEHQVGPLLECRRFICERPLPRGVQRVVKKEPRGAQLRFAICQRELDGRPVSNRLQRTERRLAVGEVSERNDGSPGNGESDGRDDDVGRGESGQPI